MERDPGFGELGAHANVWDTLARWRAAGRRFVWLTVVESRGFTPRKSGTHMLVAEDGETVGTIGGGAIEHDALREARALLEGGAQAVTLKRHLTQELGMCCGGEMVLHLEVLERMPRLFVYGAGYLAAPIARLAASVGFAVTVVDERAEWADAARFPSAIVVCADAEHHARALASGPEDFVIVVTHDHALDQRLVQTLIERPLRFLGMIGSLAKQRKFALRLEARGVPREAIARLRTPLGLEIGAQTPEEIAVSVVAELVSVRRGGEPRRGWVPRPRRAEAGLAAAGEEERP